MNVGYICEPCALYGELPARAEALVGAIVSAVAAREESLVFVDAHALLRNRYRPVVDVWGVGGVVTI